MKTPYLSSSFSKVLKNILIFSMLLLSFFGCKKEDTPTPQQQTTPTINSPIVGNWSLIKRQGGSYPTQHYDEGDIQWSFSPFGVLTTTISEEFETPPNVPFINPSERPYSLISNDSVLFSGFFKYRFLIQNDSLILSQGELASDGRIFTFKSY